MLRELRGYLSLSGNDRRLLTRAFVSLAAVEVALRVLGYGRLVERIDAASASRREVDPEDLRRARRYARWLEVASRYHIVRARCLHRSLALHRWLRQQGLPSELRIGVRKEDGELKAHAWVELGEQLANDEAAAVAAFTPLASNRPALTWGLDSADRLRHGAAGAAAGDR